ncbi:disease resistance protein RPS5-like [Citrus sinensis]|uniref:disease resistance protein RPS5-like n=1 Tax=Citrus sinensis TaxID=2711 RepID=UPI002279A084|nr:disease resistance protein RPS5-like [Citrus sinensis]
MVEIAVAIAVKVAECLVHPIIHPFAYCCNYKSNLEKLKNEVQKLRGAKESVQQKIDDAKRSGEDIEQRVENWLITADEILDAAARIIEGTEDTTNRLCPNLNTRYQVSKKAAREVKAAAELLQQEGRFDKVSYRTVPEDVWLTSIKGYEAFESRMSTLNDVINALKNPDVHMIGAYGMAGVGKTMLVKEVARQAKADKLFDEVVYAEVSQRPDVKKIQGQIADKLGLKFYEESESGRARKLCERLKKEKKILVILDDIWTNLDLENVGIPFGVRGCRVLMTARSQDVLSSKMDCQNNFLIGVLNESEARDLFKKLVGDKIENNDLKSLAMNIVKACRGLPIAIVTIARALRNKNTFEWKSALRELTRPSSGSFSGVAAEAYKTSELSYNHLEGALKTARLRAVPNWELDEEYCWAGDLNTTLQHLNEKMAKRRMTEVEYESEMSTSEEIEEEEEEENAERPMILLDTDEDEDEEYGEDDEDEEYSEYDEDEEYGEDDEDEEDDGEDDDIHSY